MSCLLNVVRNISTNKTRKMEKFDKNFPPYFAVSIQINWNGMFFLVFSSESMSRKGQNCFVISAEELDEQIVVHQKLVMSLYSPETIPNLHKYRTGCPKTK